MNRRFLNVAVQHMNSREVPYGIHRINPANLFYPPGSPVPGHGYPSPADEATTTMEDVPLPPSSISFDWPSHPLDPCSMKFMAFGRDRDKILAVDTKGRTSLYDAALRSIRTSMPVMPQRILKPITVAVGDGSLYVASVADGTPQFVALVDARDPNGRYSKVPMWQWQFPQPPPFPSYFDHQEKYPFDIGAYTVVDDAQIWVSTVGAGTFSFDMKSGEWSKLGEWALPFRGSAEYIPEHKLWFGFSDTDEQQQLLCASDLAAAVYSPPVAKNLSRDIGVWPKDWMLRSTHLLPLGAGKLCTARFFKTSDNIEDNLLSWDRPGLRYMPDTANNFVVLVGVEVSSDDEGRLRMIRHKSQRYTFGLDYA